MSELANRASDEEERHAKLRKVRKGTRSCWECRRRKIKCRFASDEDAICAGCQARGTRCVSQEFAEEQPQQVPDRRLAQRLGRVEDLLEKLAGRIIAGPNTPPSDTSATPAQQQLGQALRHVADSPACSGGGTSVSGQEEEEQQCPYRINSSAADAALVKGIMETLSVKTGLQNARLADAMNNCVMSSAVINTKQPMGDDSASASSSHLLTTKQHSISKFLHDMCPSQHDVDLLVENSPGPHFLLMFFNSYAELGSTNMADYKANLPDCLKVPPATSHPTMIAKFLMVLTHCLLQITPKGRPEGFEFKESFSELTVKFTTAVTELVLSNDNLLGSVEGLEVLVMMTLYHSNLGNLRKAWLNCRKTIAISQLMGLDKCRKGRTLKSVSPNSPPETRTSPVYLWFRTVFQDRYLSLVLGLPPSTDDDSFIKDREGIETPQERLERLHTVISLRISKRNMRHTACELLSSEGSDEAYTMTQSIDCDLERAARSMGVAWWQESPGHDRPPLPFSEWMKAPNGPAGYLRGMGHVMLQMHHHNLVILTHLPFVLRDPKERRWDYSKATAMNAARELMRGFICFRRFLNDASFACRHTDYGSLTAAMTLLLGYLDPRQRTHDEATVRRRFADRELVKEVKREMQKMAQEKDGKLSREASDIIERLLPLTDVDASEGETSGQGSANGGARECHMDFGDAPVTLNIPSLGKININPSTDKRPVGHYVQQQSADRAPQCSPLTCSDIPLTPASSGRAPSVSQPFVLPGGLCNTPNSNTPYTNLSGGGGTGAPTPSSQQQDFLHADAYLLQPDSDFLASLEAANTNPGGLGGGNHGPPFLQLEREADDSRSAQAGGGGTPMWGQELTAEADQWTFQGVDANFFESLLLNGGDALALSGATGGGGGAEVGGVSSSSSGNCLTPATGSGGKRKAGE